MMFVGLMAVNYISNYGVQEMVNSIAEDTDLSEYGIFVNADGDYIEEEEEQLRESPDFYGEERRQL